jgi:threonine dehydratase
MFSRQEFEQAQAIVYAAMAATPQYAWPLLCEATGCEVWLKHENHTPIGAFKLRGGLVHMRHRRERGQTKGVITATRGNHGQSIPFAARREGIAATVVVPHGNSPEKNAAIRALGAELVEAGDDFDAARATAQSLAAERGLDMVASFQPDLVRGVSTYAHELFTAVDGLDAVYVPIGLGSGICGVIAMRDLLGLKTQVIGVSSERANGYAQSFRAGKAVGTSSAATFADGMATRQPVDEAVSFINKGAERIAEVSDAEIAQAIRLIYRATHNVAEGAGAAALAALMKERHAMAGKRIGLVLTGGNIDSDKLALVLTGGVPGP